MPVTTCRAFRVDPASRFPRRRRFRFGKPNVLIIIRPVRRSPLGTYFPVGLYPCFRDRYALVGASRAGSGPKRAEGRSVRARSGVPISPEVSKKSCRALVASGRNLTIGKRQGLLQLFDSGIAAGGRRTVAVRMESRLSGLSRASVKFCMSGRSCPARGGCDLRHLVRARGRLAFRGPHPIAPMNSASCRRFAGSGTSAALRQRSACTICGNVPETSHSLPERSLVSVRIRPSNSSSVRSCRPPVDRLPTACGSLQMPTSLPSAEAGSGDHVSPTAVFPSLSVLAKKWVVPFNPRCASSGEGSSICRIKSRNSSRRDTAMLSEMCFLLTWTFTLFRRVAYR